MKQKNTTIVSNLIQITPEQRVFGGKSRPLLKRAAAEKPKPTGENAGERAADRRSPGTGNGKPGWMH